MIFQLLPGAMWGDEENLNPGSNQMTWTAPVFEEVVLCCEINSYVSAKL